MKKSIYIYIQLSVTKQAIYGLLRNVWTFLRKKIHLLQPTHSFPTLQPLLREPWSWVLKYICIACLINQLQWQGSPTVAQLSTGPSHIHLSSISLLCNRGPRLRGHSLTYTTVLLLNKKASRLYKIPPKIYLDPERPAPFRIKLTRILVLVQGEFLRKGEGYAY